ncbi:MalM family protein [Endozoicomonas arenosclerae]|uniref:MalM family protein n=1 Tax=Endozoicomonas arenosclerae TaxID=1633495 RepID=UPI0015609A93|nr:MalM family protein [Endozoicomonas arenosclerae]
MPDTFQDERPEQTESEGKLYDSMAAIKCQPLKFPAGKDRARVVVNEFTSRLKQPSGETPFLAFKIPETGVHKVIIDSYVVKAGNKEELFYPEVVLLDRKGSIVGRVPASQVKYRKPGFTTGEGVEARFVIDNRIHSADRATCMLIYTTDKSRQETTTLVNEAKEYAKAYGVVAPPVPDPVALHGNQGHLGITIKSSDVYTSEVVPMPVAASAVALPKGLPTAVEDSFSKEVRQHYVNAVNSGLKSGSISQALDARSELRNIVRATEGYFVSQYGKPVEKLDMPKAPDGKDGYAGKVLYHYQMQVADQLKAGQGAAALQAVDQIKGVQEEVDQLFNK